MARIPPAGPEAIKRRRQQAAKAAVITRKHVKLLLNLNERMDEFERAQFSFYKQVYNDVKGNRRAFHAAVTKVQALLRNDILPLARINDGKEKRDGWFDRIARSTHS